MTDAPRLHVEWHGAGPTVLLLHGFAGSARNFRPQVRALADRFRVVLYDARGHARSEAPDAAAAYCAEALVGDVGRVLEQAGAERAVVGGLSMGAALALAFARAHPERVRGLLLASFPAGRGAAGAVSAQAEAFADAIEGEGLDAAGARFVWGPHSGLDARAAALVRQGFLEHPPHGLVHTLRSFLAGLPAATALTSGLAGFAMPTLLVAGAEDAPALAATRALAAALPQAQCREIPAAGHVVNLERPAPFNAALEAFLGELPA